MNVESTSTAVVTRSNDTSSSSTSSASSSKSDSTTSFKDQLDSVKKQDSKSSEDTKTDKTSEINESNEANEAQQTKTTQQAEEKTNQKTSAQEVADKLSKEFALAIEKNDAESLKKSNPSDELSSSIAKLSEMMKSSGSKTQEIKTKSEDISDKLSYCHTMKMDNNDINFFLNLVNNQQMTAQAGQSPEMNGQNKFADIKSEATQASVQVSATLLDAMNESAKTGKPFRIDFGNDVAVVMKVDKQGVLSANFIPGSAAVENYLRNNIEGLRQSFDSQDLPYNELSYSNQQKQDQKERQSKNNKEESNE